MGKSRLSDYRQLIGGVDLKVDANYRRFILLIAIEAVLAVLEVAKSLSHLQGLSELRYIKSSLSPLRIKK